MKSGNAEQSRTFSITKNLQAKCGQVCEDGGSSSSVHVSATNRLSSAADN